MYNTSFMQIAKSKHYLCSNKLHSLLLKPFNFVYVVVDVSTRQVLKEKVNSEFILEDEVHGVYKGVFCLEQNVLLILNVLNLFLLQEQVFVYSFHGVHFVHLPIVD